MANHDKPDLIAELRRELEEERRARIELENRLRYLALFWTGEKRGMDWDTPVATELLRWVGKNPPRWHETLDSWLKRE